MRCPHCRSEIPEESKFCGVCGQNVHISQIGSRPVQAVPSSSALSPAPERLPHEPADSLFEVPVSGGARMIRLGLIVLLNLAMVGAGVALVMGYLGKREAAARGKDASAEGQANANDSEVAGAPGSDAAPSREAEPTQRRPGETSPSEPSSPSSPTSTSGTAGSRTPSIADAGVPRPRGAVPDARPSAPPASRPTRPPATTPPATTPQRSPDAGPRNSGGNAPRRVDAGSPRRTADAGATASAPGLTPEEQEEQVRLLAGKIGLVVERQQPQLSRCYENALKQTNPNDNEPLAGRINVHFTVLPSGAATGIRVRSNSTGSPSLASCLVRLVGSWTFPSSGSEPLDFVWPFEFQAP